MSEVPICFTVRVAPGDEDTPGDGSKIVHFKALSRTKFRPVVDALVAKINLTKEEAWQRRLYNGQGGELLRPNDTLQIHDVGEGAELLYAKIEDEEGAHGVLRLFISDQHGKKIEYPASTYDQLGLFCRAYAAEVGEAEEDITWCVYGSRGDLDATLEDLSIPTGYCVLAFRGKSHHRSVLSAMPRGLGRALEPLSHCCVALRMWSSGPGAAACLHLPEVGVQLPMSAVVAAYRVHARGKVADDSQVVLLHNMRELRLSDTPLLLGMAPDAEYNVDVLTDTSNKGRLLLAALRGDAGGVRSNWVKGGEESGPGGPWANLPSPLHLAAGRGHAEVVQLLLTKGADPGGTSAGGIGTADYQAAMSGSVAVVELLLTTPAGQGPGGGTLLDRARGQAALGRQLAEARTAPGGSRQYRVGCACAQCWSTTWIMSEESPREEELKRRVAVPILTGAVWGGPAVLGRLLQAGCPVDVQGGDGESPLMAACRLGKAEEVRLLLAAGAKWELRDMTGNNALHWAAKGGSVECIKALLAAGADPLEITDMILPYEAVTRMSGRKFKGQQDLVGWYQRCSARQRSAIYSAAVGGVSPLYLAVARGGLEGVEALLKVSRSGASSSNKQRPGIEPLETLLDVAMQEGQQGVAALLMEMGPRYLGPGSAAGGAGGRKAAAAGGGGGGDAQSKARARKAGNIALPTQQLPQEAPRSVVTPAAPGPGPAGQGQDRKQTKTRRQAQKQQGQPHQQQEEQRQAEDAPEQVRAGLQQLVAAEREALRAKLGLTQDTHHQQQQQQQDVWQQEVTSSGKHGANGGAAESTYVCHCSLRPEGVVTGGDGACCSVTPDTGGVAAGQRRISLRCSRDCAIHFHYPNCWREAEAALKASRADYTGLRGAGQLGCLTQGCAGWIVSGTITDGHLEAPKYKQVLYSAPAALMARLKQQQQAEEEARAKANAQAQMQAQKAAKSAATGPGGGREGGGFDYSFDWAREDATSAQEGEEDGEGESGRGEAVAGGEVAGGSGSGGGGGVEIDLDLVTLKPLVRELDCVLRASTLAPGAGAGAGAGAGSAAAGGSDANVGRRVGGRRGGGVKMSLADLIRTTGGPEGEGEEEEEGAEAAAGEAVTASDGRAPYIDTLQQQQQWQKQWQQPQRGHEPISSSSSNSYAFGAHGAGGEAAGGMHQGYLGRNPISYVDEVPVWGQGDAAQPSHDSLFTAAPIPPPPTRPRQQHHYQHQQAPLWHADDFPAAAAPSSLAAAQGTVSQQQQQQAPPRMDAEAFPLLGGRQQQAEEEAWEHGRPPIMRRALQLLEVPDAAEGGVMSPHLLLEGPELRRMYRLQYTARAHVADAQLAALLEHYCPVVELTSFPDAGCVAVTFSRATGASQVSACLAAGAAAPILGGPGSGLRCTYLLEHPTDGALAACLAQLPSAEEEAEEDALSRHGAAGGGGGAKQRPAALRPAAAEFRPSSLQRTHNPMDWTPSDMTHPPAGEEQQQQQLTLRPSAPSYVPSAPAPAPAASEVVTSAVGELAAAAAAGRLGQEVQAAAVAAAAAAAAAEAHTASPPMPPLPTTASAPVPVPVPRPLPLAPAPPPYGHGHVLPTATAAYVDVHGELPQVQVLPDSLTPSPDMRGHMPLDDPPRVHAPGPAPAAAAGPSAPAGAAPAHAMSRVQMPGPGPGQGEQEGDGGVVREGPSPPTHSSIIAAPAVPLAADAVGRQQQQQEACEAVSGGGDVGDEDDDLLASCLALCVGDHGG